MALCISYEDAMVEELRADEEFATAYLQFAFENFEQDNDMPMLLNAIRRFLLARDGIDAVAQKLALSSDSFMNILTNKEKPSFAVMQQLCDALGYRVLVAKKEMAVQEAA